MTIQPAEKWGNGPGLFVNVDAEKYHGLREFAGVPVTSNSTLSALMDCPARCKEQMDNGMEETPSMEMGTILHAAMLEPMEYAMHYVTAGQCTGVTTKGTRCSRNGVVRRGGAFYCSTHAPDLPDDNVKIVSKSNEQKIVGVGGALNRYRPAKAILNQPGGYEVSMLWKHEPSGLWIRNRVDFLSLQSKIAMDLKKTRDASRPGFEKSVSSYGYHRQGTLYDMGFKALGVDDMHFVFLAQEDKPPYIAAARRLTNAAYEVGRRELELGYINGNGDYVKRGLLDHFAACVASGEWPGYEEKIGDVGVTAWYERNLIDAEVAA